MIKEVLSYIKNDMSVFPLRGKRPLFEWKDYQKTVASPSQAKLWWGIHRGANIGLVTGEVSRLFILDFDHDSQSILEKAKPIIKNFVPRYALSRTGKGFHVWIHCSDAQNTTNTIVARRDKDTVYIETRGQGGYIVAPPSIHPEYHKKYKFLVYDERTFHDLPSVTSKTIEALIKCLHDEFNEYTPPPPSPPKNKTKTVNGVMVVHDRKRYIDAVIENNYSKVASAGVGIRNRVLFEAAANLGEFGQYISTEEIFNILMEASESNGYVHDDGRASAAKTIASGIKRSTLVTIDEDPFMDLNIF